ncbi:LacI family DNA-binding transcriptional regulator [Ochrobactrum teleogrylli]
MKPTAKQVAHAAGVSLSAVSRAFTPGAPLDETKRKRILMIAEKLGYISPARRTAQAIAKDTVTLVAGDLLNPFYPVVLDTLARQLQSSGRQLLVYAVPAREDVDALIAQIIAARPSGVIVTSTRLTSGMARACRQHGIKIVLLNRIQRDVRAHTISCDNYSGGRDAARLLLTKGRQRIAFVGGLTNTSTHQERARGFRDELKEVGLNLYGEVSGDFNYNVAYGATMSLLIKPKSPDAIFCCNDIMALAAIDAIKERGMVVGEDIAIIGFDDIPMAAWTSYRLSTVRQPIDRMVQEAIHIISDDSLRPSDEGFSRLLPGKLMIRASA